MKTAILFGATGLVGNQLLKLLIENNDYHKIKIFSRKEILTKNPKLQKYVIDFNELEKFKDEIFGDDCFFAIGTTRKLTPNKNDYINIELNLPVKISKIAKNNNVKSFIYVSSGGANANSINLYLQNKGKAENEIINLSFEFTAIIRPSLLLGNRKENRIGEKIAKFIFKNLSFIFIGKLRVFKPIQAKNVAKSIMYIKNNQVNDLFFTSDKLENFSLIK
tara:strand:+ start:671 stop:1330 length:660 start_codon:yes stop_codon:yes gene_type:complete